MLKTLRISFLLSFCAIIALPAVASAARLGAFHRADCPGPSPANTARCNALVVTDSRGKPFAATGPVGFGPADLWNAYKVSLNPSSTLPAGGAGKTIAIVDAYNAPTAEAD